MIHWIDAFERSKVYVFNQAPTKEQELESLIDEWHEITSDQSLHEYVGMTWEEWSNYVYKRELPERYTTM